MTPRASAYSSGVTKHSSRQTRTQHCLPYDSAMHRQWMGILCTLFRHIIAGEIPALIYSWSRGIRISWQSDPWYILYFCILGVGQNQRQTEPKTKPKTKPKTTPKTTPKTKIPEMPIEIIPLSTLGPTAPHARPRYDGYTHGDNNVWIDRGPLTVIAVDPGHVTLVDAVRHHPDGVHLNPLPIDASLRQTRYHKLKQKLAEKDRTHFSLPNVQWTVLCGRRVAAARIQHLMKKMELQPAIDLLSQYSSRVSSSVAYMEHLRTRLDTLDTMKRLVKAKAPSRWKFECYQKEQLAAHQLSKDLLFGCTGPSVVVWGNGGFGPTSHGHASAPNKRLRRLLSKYIPVILSSEFRSSKRSACCHSHLTDRPSPKRVTVKQCTTCKTLLSRDVSAACIILDIFEFQRLNQTKDLPAFIH